MQIGPGIVGAGPPKLFSALLGVVALGAVVSVAVAHSALVSFVVLTGITVATVVMIAIGIARYRSVTGVWWFLILAFAASYSGFVLREFIGGGETFADSPIPDLVTVVAYLGLAVAALKWLRPRSSRDGDDVLLDTVLIAVGAMLSTWVFLIAPVLNNSAVIDAKTLATSAYPVFDALMLAVVAHSVFTASEADTSLRLVQFSMAGVLVGDIGYCLNSAGTTHFDLSTLLVPYLVAWFAGGLAALHPSMLRLGAAQRVHSEHSRQRATVVAVALGAAAVVPLVRSNLDLVDRIVIATLLITLFLGLLVRSERAISRSRKSERRAAYQASHDMLTGLPNRSALLRTLDAEARSELATGRVSLLFVDLDGFKLVNDSYGHAVGDELIAHAAARVRQAIRHTDVAARYGGDEFVVVAHVGRAQAADLAERLIATIGQPFQLSAGDVTISASVGIAFADNGLRGSSVDDLIRDADSAMYLAKNDANGSYAFADDVLDTIADIEQFRRASNQ